MGRIKKALRQYRKVIMANVCFIAGGMVLFNLIAFLYWLMDKGFTPVLFALVFIGLLVAIAAIPDVTKEE